jgi:hypothetical protein
MKTILAFSFLIVSIFAQGQEKADTILAEHYQTADFDCAIFPAKALANGTYNIPAAKRFTPTRDDIDKAETALKTQLAALNKKKVNQLDKAIEQILNQYQRQYYGYIDKTGNKILYINCFYKDNTFGFGKTWLNYEVQVDDGGSAYWNIKFNLKKGKLFDLRVNGYA